MSDASEMAIEITRLLPDLKSGSLVVFGDIFGGRIDNIHRVIAAEAIEASNTLVVRFDEDEVLKVADPGGAEFGAQVFKISSASAVRWEWFYYGRPRTAENRFFIQHAWKAGRVVADSDATWAPMDLSPTSDRRAVELLGWND